MPTVLTHPAVPLAMAWGLGKDVIPKRLLIAGVIASVIPDLDVLAFRLGIPYAAEFGHRGFSHSLMFAFMAAIIGTGLTRYLRSTPTRTFWFLFVAVASHGVLDAFTSGGLGVAFLWPFSAQRFFAPVHPIKVSPIGLTHFLSSHGLAVLRSELLWVWLPCLGTATIVHLVRRYLRFTATTSNPALSENSERLS